MISRGELWWAELGAPRGSAPALRRPVLIISADAFNASRIGTVTCIALTSNMRLADAPGNVPLDRGQGGLTTASVVNVSQVVTLDRDLLGERIGRLNPNELAVVEAGLRLAIGL